MAQNRINKINDQIRRELSEIIRGLKDSRIPLMTSVIAVDTTGDLRYAKVFVSVMGDENIQKNALEGLSSAAGFIRRELGHRMDIRYTPELLFSMDHSIEYGAHINDILHKIDRE